MKQIIILLTIITFGLFSLHAQDVPALTQLKSQVDAGTTSVDAAAVKAKDLGLTPEQIEMAKAHYQQDKGQPADKKATSTSPKVDNPDDFWSNPDGSDVVDTPPKSLDDTQNPDDVITPPPTATNQTASTNGVISGNGYFGYGLFQNGNTQFSAIQKGPVDPNYRIGPGDEVVVSVWGDVEFRNSVTVNRDGTINLDKIGVVVVNGLTLKDLEKKLRNNLGKVYSTINGNSASTFLDVTLGKLKPITIFFVGEVSKPGAYQVSSYSTAFNALYSIGGPNTSGSLRKIQVIRDGVTITEFDLYDYLLTGKKIKDIRLEHGDNIFVPNRETTISLKGEVRRPAIYEMLKNETLADLVKYAGGLETTTDLKRVQIERIVPFEKRVDNEKVLDIQDYNLAFTGHGQTIVNPIKLFDRDVITIYPLRNTLDGWATISGSIFRPGKYAIEKGMNVRKLIEQAQGLMPDAFPDKVDLTRTHINGEIEHLSINLNTNSADTTLLEDFDDVKIYSIWELVNKNKFVEISGHIRQPGKYQLLDSMRVMDLITKAGAIADHNFKKTTYLIRADLVRYNDDELTTRTIPLDLEKLLAGDTSLNLQLKHRDKLLIYSTDVLFIQPKVTISGAVKNPGTLNLPSNMTLHDLILRAGGFNRNAYLYSVDVYRVDPYHIKPDSLAIFQTVTIDPKMLNSFQTADDFKLQDLDFVVVREHPDFQYMTSVTITGEVKFPGTYVLLHKNETFKEIVQRAGGLKDDCFIDGITLRRQGQRVGADFKNMLNSWGSSNDLAMMDGDIISIPVKPNTVRVQGFVNRPCLVQYREDWSLNDYIEAAGGVKVDETMDHTGTMVTYVSGISKTDGWFFSPEVKDGSTITLNAVKIEKLKPLETLKEWAAIAGSTATMIVAIVIMGK